MCRLRSSMVGQFPGLASLDPQDNLLHTSDFRAMYCTLLHDWFGADPGPIIPNADQFALLGAGATFDSGIVRLAIRSPAGGADAP